MSAQATATSSRRTIVWIAALLFVLSAAKGVVWAVVMPVAQQPDEPAHAVVADHIARTGSLRPGPRMPSAALDATIEAEQFHRMIFRPWSIGSSDDESIKARTKLLDTTRLSDVRHGVGQYEASADAYPPLYYATEALVVRATESARYDTTWLLERMVSVLLASLTTLVLFGLLVRCFGSVYRGASGALALILIPGYSSMESAINPEVLLVLLSTITLYGCVSLLSSVNRWRMHSLLGVVFGIGMLTKPSAVVLVAPYAVAALIACRRARLSWRAITRLAVAWLIPAAVLVIGWRLVPARPGGKFSSNPADLIADPSWTTDAVRSYLGFLQREGRFRLSDSYWGVFGWVDAPMPTWSLALGLVVFVVTGTLLVARLLRDPAPPWIWVMVTSIAAVLAMLFYIEFGIVTTTGTGMIQGRYLYGVLGAIGALQLWALDGIFVSRPRARAVFWTGLPVLAALFQVAAITGTVLPRYYL